ncbi:MAG TPA: MarR family transcriptional regulator [Acidimicrobiales bacterium]|jgi:DNA-binding MarR family transcriptional regulator|nr:MarR family transcriptional regulator [Acidimicrobiales bacterium]
MGTAYRLDDQIAFLLRRAYQRHAAMFTERMVDGITPMQFAAMAKLREAGPLSQNKLGRETAMDAATIKGVVSRLRNRGLVDLAPDPNDQRRITVSLSADGRAVVSRCVRVAVGVSKTVLGPLNPADQQVLAELLGRIADA